MDKKDEEILEIIQRGIPLVREPREKIGEMTGTVASEVERRVCALRENGCIRDISGIFDCISLGYSQSLVAFKIPADKLDAAGAEIVRHPGIGHCYGRDATYNLWFTLATSPFSTIGLEGTVEKLADSVSALGALILPTLKRYKLSTIFGKTGEVANGVSSSKQGGSPVIPNQEDQQVIRALQVDLPHSSSPFQTVAAKENVPVELLLEKALQFQNTGKLRRYAAVVYHRAMGARSNAMVVWNIDPSRMDAAGVAAAGDSSVSHCYSRPVFKDWPYGLYTMIHGQSDEDVNRSVERIAASADIAEVDRKILWTTKEYVKRRVHLFVEAELAWEKGV